MKSRLRLLRPALGVTLACAASLALCAKTAQANVFASDLRWSAPAVDATQPSPSVSLSFRLNEAADVCRVEIWRSDTNALVRTVNLGAKPVGLNTYSWDLKNDSNALVPTNVEYRFKVYAEAAGYSSWTQISDDNLSGAKYFSGRSLAVNRDPNSRYFGHIYVLNVTAGTTGGRTTPKGLYAIHPDFADAVGQGDTAILGNVAWAASVSSPFRINVGDDGKLYLFDFADAHSGVWVAPGDLSGTWPSILDPSTGENSTNVGYPFDPGVASPPAVHGSEGKGFVYGKGLNRVLYTTDEDLYPAGGHNVHGKGSVWKYPIGPLDQEYRQVPQVVYDDSALDMNFNLNSAIARDAAGNIYQTQNRFDGNESCLWKIDPTGTVVWKSLSVFGKPDPFLGNYGGVAVDDARGRLAAAGSSIYVLGLSLDPSTLTKVGGGAVVWAAGNNSSIRYNSNFTTAFAAQAAPASGQQINDVAISNTSTATGPPPTVNGYAVGNNGAIWNFSAMTTWSADTSPITTNLNGVTTIQRTPIQGWAVGDGGAILSNLGGTWNIDQAAGVVTSNNLNKIGACAISYAATPTYDLYAVGNSGTILQRLDASNLDAPTQWTQQSSGTTQNLNDISVISFAISTATTAAYAVGDAGTILKTTDGGATWTAQTSPTSNNLRGVSAPTALFAFAVGDGGVIIKTSDGGATWTSVTSPTTSKLTACFFRDTKTGWIVGEGGKLYRTTNGGASWVLATGTGTDNLNAVVALPFGNGTPRDVAFDAAGNLYEINNGTERLRVYSPPDGPNNFTTTSFGKFVPTSGDATKPATPVVTAPATSSSSSTLGATWTGTGVSYQYAIGVTADPEADDESSYTLGWTNTNATSANPTGLPLSNGVKYFFYVRAKSA
ncbi:MAG: hypothetical protein IT209_06665, partial [Armatimonadetes bacterium]|nr:hypothetical protein [Armatimonadota bacterium]